MRGTFSSRLEKGYKLHKSHRCASPSCDDIIDWLVETAPYKTIGNLFVVGKPTVCGIVKHVCEVIVRILLPRYIYVPQNRQEVQDKIDSFKSPGWKFSA